MKQLRATYNKLLRFLCIQPDWIEQWITNKAPDKSVEEKEMPINQDWGPFKRIPDIRSVKVKLGPMNELMAALGIEAKFKPRFTFKAYENYGMNKYMGYKIAQLRKLAKEDPKRYWKETRFLEKKSKTLFIMALNHVKPKWHRELPEWQIIKLFREYTDLNNKASSKVSHRRKYIEKSNKKLRPLGVPDILWRIQNHNTAAFMSLYLEEREFFKNQHGFRSGKGCKTAWQHILTIVTKADWVYEFDLSRCFSNIHIKAVSKALRKAKVPEKVIIKLEELNLTPVTNPGELRTDTKETNEWNKWINTSPEREEIIKNQAARNREEFLTGTLTQVGWQIPKSRKNTESFDWTGTDENGDVFDLDQVPYITHFNSLLAAIDMPELKGYHKELYKGTEGDPLRGLPQGLPTSPVLTITALQELFINNSPWPILMYADDGIIYGSGTPPKEEEIFQKLNKDRWGIELNRDKSKFAKLPDQEMDLKFLGMRIKGEILTAETRKGSTLKYNKHQLVDIYDMLENWGVNYYHKWGESDPLSIAEEEKWLDLESERVPYPGYEGDIREESQFKRYAKWNEYWQRTHFEKLATSRLFGLIQSRLFTGDWNPDIEQCFELTSKKNSWVAVNNLQKLEFELGERLTVFNASSVACHDLLAKLNRLTKTKMSRNTIKKLKELRSCAGGGSRRG